MTEQHHEHADVLEHQPKPITEVPAVATRVYEAELTPGYGRTVDLRIVPYGKRVTVHDGLGGVPVGVPYEEEFLDGVFDHQLKAANRVLLDFEHQPGVANIVGHGVTLATRSADGLYGSFQLHETQAGETALELVRAGVLAQCSLECLFKRSIRQASGVVQRVKAQLNKVALCREGQYTDAVVLGLRTPQPAPVLLDEELLPVEFDDGLAQRVAALGITLPARLTAHPATGTPSAEGTPEPTPADRGSGTTHTEGEV